MGGAVPAVIKFLGQVFLGTGLSGASAGTLLAVNLARVASLAVIAKLTQPKLDLSDLASQKTLTIRDTIAPQTFIYGEDLVSGPLLFANTTGVDDKELVMVVAHAGHEIDSVQRYRLDDKWIELTELSGAEDGVATSGDFLDVLEIELSKGTDTQAVQAMLTREFGANPELFNAAHTGRGWAFTSWWFAIIEGKEDVWQNQPQNLRALIRGYKVYDPRLDSTNGGVGPHRLATPSTWEWSANPALCLAHFLMDDKFGMSEESDRIDWPLVITAANICDTLVDIPTPPAGNQQPRYTCNVTFEATQDRRQVRDELVQSMLGRLVFSQGVWKMWAGATVTSDVTLTEANMAGPLSLQTVKGIDDRYNRLRGKYIDAAEKDYTAASYPEARSTAYVTQDNGEIMVETADFMSTNNFYEAQRKSVFLLRQSRNQRVLSFTGNMSCFRLQAGSVVTLNISELGFASEKFFITEWKLNPEGTIELTLVEEDDAVWTDLLRAEYATRSKTGVLTFTDTGVSPPTNLTATAFFGGVDLAWVNPAQSTFDHIEIWRSLDNNRANAILLDTSAGTTYRDQKGDAQKTRYYWIRAVDALGRVSAFEPDLTTTTAIAFPYVPQGTLVADPFIRQGASAWDLSQDPTNLIYRTGEGLDGTDAISVQVTSTGGPGGFHAFYGAARRGPGTWDVLSPGKISLTINFRISLRTKPLASIWSVEPVAVVRVSDENPALNALTYVSGTAAGEHLFTQADTVGVWFDESVSLEVTDTGTPPRYLQIGMWFVGNPAEPEFNIDFLDAVMVTPTFKGSNSTGLVPQAGSAGQTTDFLRADGTWAAPSGAGGSLPAGTVSGSILYWNGSAWTEETTITRQPGPRLDITGSTAGILRLRATNGALDEEITDLRATSTTSFVIQAVTDGGLNSNVLLSADRSGTTWLDLNINTNVQIAAGSDLRVKAPDNIGNLILTPANAAAFATLDVGLADGLSLTGSAFEELRLPGVSALTIGEGPSVPGGTPISAGKIWVQNFAPNRLIFTDDGGTDHDLLGGLVPSGTVNNATLRWNGSAWVESTGVRIDSTGGLDVNIDGGVGGLSVWDSVGTSEFQIESAGSGGDALLFAGLAQNLVINGSALQRLELQGQSISMTEIGAAPTDNPAQGQFWVRNDIPNTPMFTDDTGVDHVLNAGSGESIPAGTTTNAVLRWSGTAWVENTGVRVSSTGALSVNNDGGVGALSIWDSVGTSEFQISSAGSGGDALIFAGLAENLVINGSALQRLELQGQSISMTEIGVAPADNVAQGQFWVRNDTPNTPMFTDDTGVDHVLNAASNVNVSGTPVNNQVAVWTNSNTLEGDANFLWDGTNLEVSAASVPRIILRDDSLLAGGRVWGIRQQVGVFSIATYDDAGNFGSNLINANRSAGGTTLGTVSLFGNPLILGSSTNITRVAGAFEFQEKAAANGPTAGRGELWVKNDIPNTLWFTDDGGTDHQIAYTTGGGGITGTVANDQIVVGTGASTVDSSADLTFNSTTGILSIGDPGSADAMEIDTDATNAEIRAPSGNNLVLRHGTEIFSSYSANAGRSDYYNGTLAAQLVDWNGASSIFSGLRCNDEAGALTPVGFLTMKNVTISTTSLLPFISTSVGNFYWHRTVRFTGTANATWRIDNLGTNVPDGTALWVLNRTAFTISFTQGTGVTIRRYLGTGAPSTGTATLAAGGWCTIRKETSTAVDIAGVGIS